MVKVPHIYYVREFMEGEHGIEFRNKKRMKKLLEHSEFIIFISKAIEKKYMSLYDLNNTKQFYDGYDIEKYYIADHNILTKERINLIQVGTYSDGKGTLNTIELMYELKKKGNLHFHLEFIGAGDKEYIKRMTSLIDEYELGESIEISPYTDDVKTKLSNADILVMNSHAEGFGRVTVEGMLAGCLILGRNDEGTAEIIEHNVNGLLYNDANGFVEIMESIIKKPEYYSDMAKQGQKWALNKFSKLRTAEEFCDFVLSH